MVIFIASSNCYSAISYEIASSELLTEYDLDILRAQGCFMSGQEEGICDINNFDVINNKFVYRARSVCDSGD